MNSAALLRHYASRRDEAAFAEFVRRHIDAVYSVALRGAGNDAHLAQDIVQQVFVAVARDAGRLAAHPVLTAWLYTATRYATANVVRGERRRKSREQRVQTMEDNASPAPHADWSEVAAVLDGAMDTLGEPDRAAVLLRFMDRRSFAEIGTTLGVAEDTARKRVDRALEKLRLALRQRGVASTAAALGGALAQNAIAAAPAGLAATVTGAVLAGTGTLAGTIAFMSTIKISAGIAATLIVGAVAWQQFHSDESRTASPTPMAESTSPATDATGIAAPRSLASPAATAALVSSGGAAMPAVPARKTSGGSPALPLVPSPAPRASAATPAPAPASLAPKQNATESRVTRLNTLVGLTPDQQLQVAEIFRKEASAVQALPAGEDRTLQGVEVRQGARAEVRALLTPEQRKKYDVSPQSLGGGLRANPEGLMQRLDEVVTLSADQKKQATAIFWDDVIDQMAALPPEQELTGFRWRDKVREQLRTILTPEQQAKFEATTPYKMNGRPAGSR